MLLLVSGATKTLRTLSPSAAGVGHLLTPHTGNALATTLATGKPVAIDNGCFGGYDVQAFERLMKAVAALPQAARARILWCCVPDTLADHEATLRQFSAHAGLVRAAGIPLAFVAQNGCAPVAAVPWAEIRCLFIGGTTAWKLGPAAAQLIAEAKRRGKWVHVGRVNSFKRLAYFDALGVDSFDGGQFSRFPSTYIPRYVERLRYQQHGMTDLWRLAA